MKIQRDNNFDLVRLLLAWMVAFVHLFHLSGESGYDQFGKYFSSDFAVKGFFALSGFLVTSSYMNCKSLKDFADRRIRRIFPAYVFIVVTCFVLGASLSDLGIPGYFSNLNAWKYLAVNLAFLNFLQPTLPGVFDSNLSQFVNPALWTIKIELCLYACMPFLIAFGRRVGYHQMLIVVYLLSVAWSVYFKSIAGPGLIYAELSRQFPGQMAFFVVGAYIAVIDVKKQYLWIGTLLCGATYFALKQTAWRPLVEPAFYALVVLTVSTSIPSLTGKFKVSDVSYGVYLYHCPIIQILAVLGLFKISLVWGLLVSIVVVFIAAKISWRYLEKPLLKRSSRNAVGGQQSVPAHA